MELSRQEYPALLATLQPEQAVNILNDRVYIINKTNSDIADWLQERRKIEELYATGLRKLARRPQLDGAAALGIFQMPWQRIVSATENLAQSHENLAAKIETDVEMPLRQFQSKNREMQSITQIQGNLAAVARELASAQKKLEKDQTRTKSQSKLDEAGREWESQAPFVFEQLQAVDETRINHLRDVLTQFQTHEVDQVERNRTSAESCLNALLNIETADEIKTFAARVAGGRGSVPRRPSSGTASSTPRPISSVGPPPVPPPPRITRDGSSQQRLGSNVGQDAATATPQPEKKSSIGGLKRLGTVMRRKDRAPPPVPTSSEKRKEKGRSIFRRGDSSRSFQDLEATGQDFTPIPSVSVEPPNRQSTVERIPSLPEETQEQGPLINGTTPSHPADVPGRNQVTYPQETIRTEQGFPPPQELSALPSSPDMVSSSERDSRPPQEAAVTESDDLHRNLTIRDKPIQEDEVEAKLAMSNMANQLRLQAQSSGVNRVQGSVRGRRDVRNTMFIPGTATQETPASNTAPVTSSAIPETSLATGALALGGAAIAADGISNLTSPIKQVPPPAPVTAESPVVGASSDATSIHSSHSLAGVVQHPELTSPGLNASIIETVNTWFNADGEISKSFAIGEVALAYNPPPDQSQSETANEIIRLSSFQVLEKVAANPVLVTSQPSTSSFITNEDREDKAGEYAISLNAIRRPQPTVALKYQLHLELHDLGLYSPILLAPAWQCQEGVASVIVAYGLNPAFQGLFGHDDPEGSTVVLRNVVVSVSLDQQFPTTTTNPSASPSSPSSGVADDTEHSNPRPTSAMMKPLENASFRRKAGSVVWRLGEVRLTAADVLNGSDFSALPADRKLLVRFMTTPGVPRRGSVDVKFEVVGRAGSVLGVSRLLPEDEHNPFADETEEKGRTSGETETSLSRRWDEVPTVRKLVSGRYSAA